jgi:hypothetical protein
LGADELKVAELVGVQPGILSKKATGLAVKMVNMIISQNVCICSVELNQQLIADANNQILLSALCISQISLDPRERSFLPVPRIRLPIIVHTCILERVQSTPIASTDPDKAAI